MLNIYDDGSIELTRGNSADLTVQPTLVGESDPIVPAEGDRLIFTVGYGSRAVIRKVLTEADYDPEEKAFALYLTSEDSDIQPYKYSYDFMYIFADGRTASFPYDEDTKPPTFSIVAGVSRKELTDSG